MATYYRVQLIRFELLSHGVLGGLALLYLSTRECHLSGYFLPFWQCTGSLADRAQCACVNACLACDDFAEGPTQLNTKCCVQEAEKLWMGSGWADAARSGTDAMRLAVDVIETDDAFTFTTDVPGVSREDVKVRQGSVSPSHACMTRGVVEPLA